MTAPYYADDRVTLHVGDCLDVMRELPAASVDAIVTDPPYGLGFMDKEWDALPPGLEWATECLRLLKPGGHLLAFGGSRTWHRLAAAVEDAGFEIRDSIAWLYGSGFPKSLDVSKAIDKARHDDATHVTAFLRDARRDRTLGEAVRALGFEGTHGTHGVAGFFAEDPAKARVPSLAHWEALRSLYGFGAEMDAEVVRLNARKGQGSDEWNSRPSADHDSRPGMAESWRDGKGWTGSAARGGDPVRESALEWQGWGTALKPAFEPIVVGRKPLTGTVAANVLAHGTGAINVDGCRVGDEPRTYSPSGSPGANAIRLTGGDGRDAENARRYAEQSKQRPDVTVTGRWPTNVVLDGSQADALDQQSGDHPGAVSNGRKGAQGACYSPRNGQPQVTGYADNGGASRFFPTFRYEAKAPTAERPRADDGTAHPTVKPLDLMRWLVRLVTPRGGLVLDPFLGSGTTAEACVLEGFRCVGIERDATYLPLIEQRLRKPVQTGFDFGESA